MSAEEISRRVWKYSRAKKSHLTLMLALAARAESDGTVVVNEAELAQMCNRSRSWVRRTLVDLERQGELIRNGNRVTIAVATLDEGSLAEVWDE